MGNSVSLEKYNKDIDKIKKESKDREAQQELKYAKLRMEDEQRYMNAMSQMRQDSVEQQKKSDRQFNALIASHEKNIGMLMEKQTAQMMAALKLNNGGQLQLKNADEGEFSFVVLYKQGTGKNEKLKSISVKCNRQDTIQHIKSIIAFKYNIPVDNQKLIFNGKELEAGTVKGVGIREGSEVMFYHLRS